LLTVCYGAKHNEQHENARGCSGVFPEAGEDRSGQAHRETVSGTSPRDREGRGRCAMGKSLKKSQFEEAVKTLRRQVMNCVIYARVSSREQEREGYSIPAQLKLLKQYAVSKNFEIAQEFVDIETAKVPGRKAFGEMVQFFRKNPSIR